MERVALQGASLYYLFLSEPGELFHRALSLDGMLEVAVCLAPDQPDGQACPGVFRPLPLIMRFDPFGQVRGITGIIGTVGALQDIDMETANTLEWHNPPGIL